MKEEKTGPRADVSSPSELGAEWLFFKRAGLGARTAGSGRTGATGVYSKKKGAQCAPNTHKNLQTHCQHIQNAHSTPTSAVRGLFGRAPSG